MPAIWVVPVVKLVRPNEVAVILVRIVRLQELVCKGSPIRLVVRRIAALLNVSDVFRAAQRWLVLANFEVWHFVLVFNSQLLLVAAARQLV